MLALIACGGDDSGPGPGVNTTEDGGNEDGGDEPDMPDAGNFPFPVGRPDAMVEPGDPPEELEGQACAVDTNKLFELVSTDEQPTPAQLAVDPFDSHFGVAFAGMSEECIDALYFAEMSGASGVGGAEVSTVVDECSEIVQTSITHNGDLWLLASVDNRGAARDLWVQGWDGEAAYEAFQITETIGRETEVAMAMVGEDQALAAWIEVDGTTGVNKLAARPLDPFGEPTGDVVVLEESDTLRFAGLSLSRVGRALAALAYRRSDGEGGSAIVLDVLSTATAERDRDPWVLTEEAGTFGSVDLATDDRGGAVVYSLIQGNSRQLWLQLLGSDGRAAPVMSGGLAGGPSDPQRVVGPPFAALDASMAKLPFGYVIASRALPGGNVESPRIRVHFLDRVGSITGAPSDVALASEFGSRTAIEGAIDGRVALAWTDVLEDGTTKLTAAKLPCVGGL